MNTMLFFSTREQSHDPDKAEFSWVGDEIRAVPQVGDYVTFADDENSWIVRQVVWRPDLSRVDIICGQWDFKV